MAAPLPGRCLSAEQERRIRRLIIDRSPDQSRLAYALWTREAVQELIAGQLGQRLPIRTVGEYLRRWGLTPQKPAKRIYGATRSGQALARR